MSSSSAIQDLSNWPEWVDWPATLAATDIFVGIGGVAQAATPDPASDAPDSALWTKLFPSTSPVRPYDFADRFKGLDTRRIRSIPLEPILEFIQQHYTDFAVGSPAELPSPDALLQAFDGLTFESRRTEDLLVQQIEYQLTHDKALGDLGTPQRTSSRRRCSTRSTGSGCPTTSCSPRSRWSTSTRPSAG